MLTKGGPLGTRRSQKVAILPSGTTAPLEVKRITGAHQHLQDATHTRQAGRKRSLEASQTFDSAAAPGAAAALHRAPPPETEVPARPSPPTTDKTTPERGTVPTAPTLTAELAAAHAATHPFAKEEEIPPASWRLAGSPVLGSGRSHTTVPVPPRPAPTAARRGPAAAGAAATAATAAAGAAATAGAAVGAGAGVGAAARAGAGAAAGVDHAATTATTAAAATAALDSDRKRRYRGETESTRGEVLFNFTMTTQDALSLSNAEPGSNKRVVFYIAHSDWLSLFISFFTYPRY